MYAIACQILRIMIVLVINGWGLAMYGIQLIQKLCFQHEL